MAAASAAFAARAAAAPRATRHTPTPRRGALAGRSSGSRARVAAAAGANQPSDARLVSSARPTPDGGPHSASRDARPVPPAKGPGSAAAALQDASRVEDLLAAATLLVLPAEESAHWHAQSLHRAKRRGAASRALVRLARWLAPESNLSDGGARETCVADARFARLVEAAACAYQEDEDEDDDDDDATDADDPDEGQKRPVDTRTDAELELALDAFRALGSLAPISDPEVLANAALIGERVVGVANAREDGPKNQKTKNRRRRAFRRTARPSARGRARGSASTRRAQWRRRFANETARRRFGSCQISYQVVTATTATPATISIASTRRKPGAGRARRISSRRLVRIDPPEPPSRQKSQKNRRRLYQ